MGSVWRITPTCADFIEIFLLPKLFSDDPRAASNHGKGPFGCRRCAAAVSSATRSCSSPKWLARSPTAEARSKPNGWPSCALPHARRHDGVPAACASAAKCACSTGGPESCAITSARSSAPAEGARDGGTAEAETGGSRTAAAAARRIGSGCQLAEAAQDCCRLLAIEQRPPRRQIPLERLFYFGFVSSFSILKLQRRRCG